MSLINGDRPLGNPVDNPHMETCPVKWNRRTREVAPVNPSMLHQIWIIFSELERLDLVPKTRFREPSPRWCFIRAMNILSFRYPPVIKHGNAKNTIYRWGSHWNLHLQEKSHESIVKIGWKGKASIAMFLSQPRPRAGLQQTIWPNRDPSGIIYRQGNHIITVTTIRFSPTLPKLTQNQQTQNPWPPTRSLFCPFRHPIIPWLPTADHQGRCPPTLRLRKIQSSMTTKSKSGKSSNMPHDTRILTRLTWKVPSEVSSGYSGRSKPYNDAK